jgi:hypothetical protein
VKTRILCLGSIEGPEGARYSCNKAQAIKGNLISLLSKVLSGTCDFWSIKGESKEYFAEFLKGKKTISKGFISFFLDLISVEDHPLPPSSSLDDLYIISQSKVDFISFLRKYYETSDIIIRESFWRIFYKKTKQFSSGEFRKIFVILSFLSTANNCSVWENFSSKKIWEKVFEIDNIDEVTMLYLVRWKHLLLKYADIKDFGLLLLENIKEIKPLDRKKEVLLNRLLPILFSNGYNRFDGLINLLNSRHFSDPEDSSIITGFIHFYINLFKNNQIDLNYSLLLFTESFDSFDRFVISAKSNSLIIFLKNLIIRIKSIKDKNPNRSDPFLYSDMLTTLYISGHYRDKIIRSVSSIPEQITWSYNNFHEGLFIFLFIRYEVPWYFVRNLTRLSGVELHILFQLLEGKNLKTLVNNLIPVTNKEVHKFINYPRYSVRECSSVIETGLFWAKFDISDFRPDLRGELRRYFERGILITRLISDSIFMTDLFRFIKKNELLIQADQINPILDFIMHERYQNNHITNFQISKISLRRILNDLEEWHNQLAYSRYLSGFDSTKLKWRGSQINNFEFMLNETTYSIVQLITGQDLFNEGRNMHHCVFNYIERCITGLSSIWSLRYQEDETTVRLATIEVSNNIIIQVRKKANQLPGILEETIINEWAKSTGLMVKYL